jgi:hypothetical protein
MMLMQAFVRKDGKLWAKTLGVSKCTSLVTTLDSAAHTVHCHHPLHKHPTLSKTVVLPPLVISDTRHVVKEPVTHVLHTLPQFIMFHSPAPHAYLRL